jgi:hypothetical protein
MNKSESIAALMAALAKAQGQIKNAPKAKENPYFSSKYADLAAIWDMCREHLSANAIAVVQSASSGEGGGVTVETMLGHSSGEWISSELKVPVSADKNGKLNAQGFGSAITYAKRYMLAAMVGVATEDDDGNAASRGVSVDIESFADRINSAKDEATLKTEWEAISKIVKDAGDVSAFNALKNRVSARLAEFKKAAA